MTTVGPVVLVIDDEAPIQRLLRLALEEEGCSVLVASTGRDGLMQAHTRAPDVIFLDLGLPDMPGLEVLMQIRDWSQVPVIVLSARGDESSKVIALDGGADDYLTKPFRIPELQARLRVALRHSRRSNAGAEISEFTSGDLKIDLAHRRVWLRGKEVPLTPIEYRLLAVLVRNVGAVVTHQVLMREVWGEAYVNETHYLRVFMRQLRQKIEDDPHAPKYIQTATRIGYRLCEPEESASA